MKKTAVVFWSGTGNTESMANAVLEGMKAAGAEELEETECAPMFDAVKGSLSGKDAALFGSYGWGDGEWMRTWTERVKKAGGVMIADGVIANEAPDEAASAECEALGEKAAKSV